ncbi:MAG: hypothetical protein ACI8SK_001097, partial [Shewanella sp.]
PNPDNKTVAKTILLEIFILNQYLHYFIYL